MCQIFPSGSTGNIFSVDSNGSAAALKVQPEPGPPLVGKGNRVNQIYMFVIFYDIYWYNKAILRKIKAQKPPAYDTSPIIDSTVDYSFVFMSFFVERDEYESPHRLRCAWTRSVPWLPLKSTMNLDRIDRDND